MDEKKKYRVGADLIFDIDCDMLPTQTIEEAYFYALKLVDIMRDVYGFREVLLAFSGRRGYHVNVQDFEATRLDLGARREIIDCLTANPDSPYFVQIDPVVTGILPDLSGWLEVCTLREGHVGVCRLLDIPGIELVDNLSANTLSLPTDYQSIISQTQALEDL